MKRAETRNMFFFFPWPERPMVGDDHPIRLRKQQNLQGNERSLQQATGK